jgi:hypothetical protein
MYVIAGFTGLVALQGAVDTDSGDLAHGIAVMSVMERRRVKTARGEPDKGRMARVLCWRAASRSRAIVQMHEAVRAGG